MRGWRGGVIAVWVPINVERAYDLVAQEQVAVKRRQRNMSSGPRVDTMPRRGDVGTLQCEDSVDEAGIVRALEEYFGVQEGKDELLQAFGEHLKTLSRYGRTTAGKIRSWRVETIGTDVVSYFDGKEGGTEVRDAVRKMFLPPQSADGADPKRRKTDAPAFCTNNIDIDARTTLRRTQLVVHVLDLCQTKEFILVKAPPGSGKSALLHLIEVRLEKDGIPVTVLEVDPARDGRVQLHDAIARLDTKRESESEYGYILADEIQRLYGQSIGGEERPLSFWSWLKTSGTLLRHKLRIIAATTRRDSADPDSPRDMTEDVGFSMLQYTTSEFDTILAQFLELDVCKALKAVSADAAWSHVVNALREQCAGHAVAITLTMQKLNEYAQQKWVSMNPSDICMNLVSLILSRETALNFTRIWNRNILKPLSADDKDLADLRCEIQNAVMNDKKTVSWKTQASLARMFFIHPPAVESARRWEEIKPLFLTPLAYRRLFVDVFEGRSDGEFPASLEGLIRSALSSFSHVNLMNACDGGNFPKETSLQHMFWAGLAMALPPTTEVVPEAPAVLSQAGKRSGEIDFYVNTKLHWGIELMRLGDRLENHVKRFEKGGKYFTPNIQEFAIVDFVNHRYWPKKWPSGRIVVKFDYYYAFCTVYWGGPDKKETIRFK